VYPHLFGRAGPSFAGVEVSWLQVVIFLSSIVLMAALYLVVHRTKTGMAMRALAINQDAARLMGINVNRVISTTFFLGSMLASFAGVLTGLYYSQISFLMGFLIGLKAFTAAVLGGIGNIPGAVLGGFLLGVLESLAAGYYSSRWKDVVAFAILIIILVVRPRGLLGERVVERM
jgi:branched-chain amino acid transport system permease protein